jgi:DNA-nicking Smr family endonuclease
MAGPHIEDDDADAEAQAFRKAVRDVTPLTQAPRPAGLSSRRPRKRVPTAVTEASDPGADLLSAANVAPEEFLAFRRPGVREQVLRRLRRGQYPIEAQLDLHGLHQAAARDLLAGFIASSRDAGRRCVRIIHGKGYRSGPRGPVLKSAVNAWLRRHPDVMAFASARPLDGGAGALYALLRA